MRRCLRLPAKALSESNTALEDFVIDGANLEVAASNLGDPRRACRCSLQAVSRHIQVLVRSGLVAQERTGRIARCNLDAAPLYDAAVWLNHYTHYWQQQFDDLSAFVKALPPAKPKRAAKKTAKKRKAT